MADGSKQHLFHIEDKIEMGRYPFSLNPIRENLKCRIIVENVISLEVEAWFLGPWKGEIPGDFPAKSQVIFSRQCQFYAGKISL